MVALTGQLRPGQGHRLGSNVLQEESRANMDWVQRFSGLTAPVVTQVVSNASCTTNGMASVCKVLDDSFGVQCGSWVFLSRYCEELLIPKVAILAGWLPLLMPPPAKVRHDDHHSLLHW